MQNNNLSKINDSVFREYDIRGVVGETLDDSIAYHIGKSFARIILNKNKGKLVVVGRDGRLSSPNLEKSLIAGLIDSGIDVASIGLGPSPMLYYSVYKLKAAGGVMVTGSHNPKNHNGFKFMLGDVSLYGKDIKNLYKIISVKDYISGTGSLTKKEIFSEYLSSLISAYKTKKGLNVAWDSGSGATGEVVENLSKKLPGKHILLNTKIDGNFPAHHPDPTVDENMQQLIETVKKEKCDIGIAFDGDGDRIGVVDAKGRMLAGDQLLIIFAHEILSKNPSASVIADVKASRIFTEEIKKLGGKPIIWKSGHSLIKAKMKETGAILAGEMSGHFFIKDGYFGFDDGPYAAVRLINYLAETGKKISDIFDALPVMHNTPEYRIACGDEKKFKVIENITQRLKAKNSNFIDIDGVRVESDIGWWLVRVSNTQPAISARCEAISQDSLNKIIEELKSELSQEGLELNNSAGH